MDGNKEQRDKWRSRAIVIKCSDAAYNELLQQLRMMPDCCLVYSKTSSLKLVVKEEGW